MELIVLFLKLIVALGTVLALMYLLYKLSDTKIQQINNTKYIKVLERTQLSKDSSILLVKLGSNAYVMSSTSGKNEIIKELNADEISEYEASKMQNNYENIVGKIFKRESKDEKYE